MIAIVDYGAGNLFSLSGSLAALGIKNEITRNPERLSLADQVILPGVGAFADAMQKLKQFQLDKHLQDLALSGKPLLGICLGMQLLFERGFEYGGHEGLGLIPGNVVPLPANKINFKVPQIGWNRLNITQKSKIFRYTKQDEYVYFVHSYYANTAMQYITATVTYGIAVTAAVQNKRVFGTQFHPEKSGQSGLNMLKAFANL